MLIRNISVLDTVNLKLSIEDTGVCNIINDCFNWKWKYRLNYIAQIAYLFVTCPLLYHWKTL
jgi:hypothetical protein